MNSSTLFAKLQAFCQAGLKNLLCLGFLLFTDLAISQVSNIDSLLPIEGVVIPKAQSKQQQTVKPLAVFKDCDDCPEMVVIPAASFLMGSPPDPEQDPFSNAKPVKIGEDDEKPQHRVNILLYSGGRTMSYFLYASVGLGTVVMRVNEDNSVTCIPTDTDNTDYAAYLEWQSSGNTAEQWTETDGE